MTNQRRDRQEQATVLLKRSEALLRQLRLYDGGRESSRVSRLAVYYNQLRRDTVNFVADSQSRKLIPGSVWCLQSVALAIRQWITTDRIWWYGLGSIAALAIIAGLMSLFSGTNFEESVATILIAPIGVAMLAAMAAIALIAGSLYLWILRIIDRNSMLWWWAASVKEIEQRATALHRFLRKYIADEFRGVNATEPSGEGSALETGGTQNALESERHHGEILYQEQRARYEQLTARIAALTDDLGRELDSERKVILEDRLRKLTNEREQVRISLWKIERALNDR